MTPRDHSHAECDHEGLSRRTVVRAGGAALTVPALAGCIGGDGGQAPDPISLAGTKQCDVCGMVIEKHPGPNGQLFYREHGPEEHDNPAWFDSLKQCFFPYRLEHEKLGWEVAAAYVTDYSSVEYSVSGGNGEQYISSHTEPESFARAKDAVYVVGTNVKGAMGNDFMPFSSEDDASSFADEYGGEVVEYGQIDEGLIGR